MARKKNKPGIGQSTITRRVKEASQAGRIIITKHASERGRQKGISDAQLRDVAKYGVQVQTEPAEAEDLNPKTEMRRRVAGDDVTIIASIVELPDGESAVIITGWK